VYFVHNRVHNIHQIARKLQDLVPEAEFGVGHGQMPEHQLSDVMERFTRGEIDVLVCTTIIESGLDIPNVNTIIINDANRLGLAQLYQLRGRVGRGAARAYAYLLYERHRVLTEPAQKRLQAIFEATELGAGFQIALRDLEIRGAGNLLGAEQSGHISAVGFELYSRMLAEAVERLRAVQRGETPPVPSTAKPPLTLDLPVSAFIPEPYVPEINVRLNLYQRMADIGTLEEAEEFELELEDRFGPVPEAVRSLLYVVRVRVLAREVGASGVTLEGDQVVVRLAEDAGEVPSRPALQHEFPDGVRVSRTQVRIDLYRWRDTWQDMLLAVLSRMASARRKPEVVPTA
jgi:transcription-repair coupling factor (superfamily II helicase)